MSKNEKFDFSLKGIFEDFDGFRKFACSFFELDESLSDEELISEAEKRLKVLENVLEKAKAVMNAKE